MAGPSLPPRAYTKDILAQAFEWLKKQPASIRELATSADNLVSLYETAQRRSQSPEGVEESNSSPSSRAFRKDLKNLAQDLKNFDANSKPAAPPLPSTPPPPAPAPESTPAPQVLAPTLTKKQAAQNSFLNQFGEQLALAAQPPPVFVEPVTVRHDPLPAPAAGSVMTPPPTSTPTPQVTAPVSTTKRSEKSSQKANSAISDWADPRTLEMVQMVREKMNLASDADALRMLVAMGFDRIRDILPRG